ncbi:MAG: thermonuclease family protein [Candidatus Nanopelagicales bacterium]|jgi:micrococcal nuclease|nr:thermonuclease family protein [Candidatus Nanopelagicales bacterium]MDP4715474.1 thermonuclease family protein [Candidatus Nanopelagicales bacterium]MDP4907789.1 thermonuclease family protein [Candidatus Nanopelagicales bacterium]MDP4976080.1 thermonuclease family protein [Candidatus Nanopelagicales bacterium]MDP5095388.1 thermonuclease family protein [Candidatus Nanopelagicales bacterium]
MTHVARTSLVVACLCAALVACGSSEGRVDLQTGIQQGPYDVVRTVDGDTIRVDRDGEEIVVRLIGIDTPETVAQDRPIECFGPEATARTAQLVEGKQVWLEYDEVSGLTDKYDRTLAYVWLTTDLMLNEQLVREGFAEEYTYSEGARYQAQMVQAEGEARASRAGLWSAC